MLLGKIFEIIKEMYRIIIKNIRWNKILTQIHRSREWEICLTDCVGGCFDTLLIRGGNNRQRKKGGGGWKFSDVDKWTIRRGPVTEKRSRVESHWERENTAGSEKSGTYWAFLGHTFFEVNRVGHWRKRGCGGGGGGEWYKGRGKRKGKMII